MADIYDVSWNENSFRSKVTLFFKVGRVFRKGICSHCAEEQAEACSIVSSAYYSIASTASARLHHSLHGVFAPLKVPVWLFTWLPLGAWCLLRALSFSNKVVHLIGYDGMSADQCDVRQSILRVHGLYQEAVECINFGLAKHASPHTRGLLFVGMMRILSHSGESAGVYINELLSFAIQAAQDSEEIYPLQASRIYWHCAEILSQNYPEEYTLAGELRVKACGLVIGANDQILKQQ